MKAFIVAFLLVAAVSQGYGQFWPGTQGQVYQQFQPPQVNFQEMAQKYAPAVQNWRENLPVMQNPGFKIPQGNIQELVQQHAPAIQQMQQRYPQMPANFAQVMQSPFAQNLKSQVPANYQQVLESAPFKNWAENVMKMPNVQGMRLPN